MKKLYLLPILTLISFALIYSCSTEEEDTTPPASVVATPEPEPPAPTQYTLTVTAGEGGSVSTEGGTFDEGTEVTITATPEEGYEFIGWEGSDSDSNSLTITLNGETTIQAIFEKIVETDSDSHTEDSNTETNTENVNSGVNSQIVGSVESVPSGQASLVLTNINDDGKGNITHTYELVHGDPYRIARITVRDENGFAVEEVYPWSFITNLEYPPGYTFDVDIREFEYLVHRDVEIYRDLSQPMNLSELDSAMDLSGENWVCRRITVLEYIDGNNGYATGPVEMLIGAGSSGTSGFNTRVLLHENGHNFDFTPSKGYRDVITQTVYDNLPEIHANGVTLEQFPYVEFLAEAFAWYYLYPDDLPDSVVTLLDSLLN
jgi:hypothetical protein